MSSITIDGDLRIFENTNYVTVRNMVTGSVFFGIKGHISGKVAQDNLKAKKEAEMANKQQIEVPKKQVGIERSIPQEKDAPSQEDIENYNNLFETDF